MFPTESSAFSSVGFCRHSLLTFSFIIITWSVFSTLFFMAIGLIQRVAVHFPFSPSKMKSSHRKEIKYGISHPVYKNNLIITCYKMIRCRNLILKDMLFKTLEILHSLIFKITFALTQRMEQMFLLTLP